MSAQRQNVVTTPLERRAPSAAARHIKAIEAAAELDLQAWRLLPDALRRSPEAQSAYLDGLAAAAALIDELAGGAR